MEFEVSQSFVKNISQQLEFSQEDLDILMPLIMKQDKMAVFRYVFGSRLESDENFNYKQPIVKKWVNSNYCNKIIKNVTQIDACQYFPKIASMYLCLENSNENIIATICNKFTNLRDKYTGIQKDMIKKVVNCLVGYLVTKPKTYEKLNQELKDQYKSHRCTQVHQKITQIAFEIMDNLEKTLSSENIEIVAFKTDSVFIIDETGNSAELVQNYFKSLGFQSKVIKYSKFMHAQSRKSEQDVCYYIGLTEKGESIASQDEDDSEVNGIVKKCNREIVKDIVADILNGEQIDLNSRIQQVFQSEFNRQLDLINTPEQTEDQIKKLIKQFGNQSNQIACLTRKNYYQMGVYGHFKKLYNYKKVDWKYNSYEFNQFQQRKALQAFKYILTNDDNVDFSNPTMFEPEFADYEDLQQMIHARIDHDNHCSSKDLGAYDHVQYSTINELKTKPNVTVHEYFHLNHGKLFIDVDCDSIRDLKYFNMDIEVLNNLIIKDMMKLPLMSHLSKLDYSVAGYKNNNKLSLHIVFDLVMSFRVQSQIMKQLSKKYGNMIDSDVNRQGRTLRLPFFEKVSSSGISTDKMLKPLFDSKEGLSNYFICHMLDNTPIYNEPEFALDQNTLSITNKFPLQLTNDITKTIEEQLKKQRSVEFVYDSIQINKKHNHYGSLEILDYYTKYTKCSFCSGNHSEPRHRTILSFELVKQANKHYINITGGFRCKLNKDNNPLNIEIGEFSLKTKSNYHYNGTLTPTFNTSKISDYIPIKLKNKTIYIIISDMGSGKSEWTYRALKDLIGACLISTRKSQTKGFVSKYSGFVSYQESTGNLDISSNKIMVQLESILRIIGNGVPLVFDEFKSILAIINTLADPIGITRKLSQLMRESSCIVILDCFLEQQDIDIFGNIIRNFMDDQEWTIQPYINGYKHRTNQKVTVYRDVGFKNSDFERVLNQIKGFCEKSKLFGVQSPNNMGRCVGFIGSASKLVYITEILRKLGYVVGDYSGLDENETINYLGAKMTMKAKKELEFANMVEVSKHYNIILYSQTITVGLDIPNPDFKYAVHYFKNKTGNQIQFIQGMHRFRQVIEHVVYSNCMVNWQLAVTNNKTIAQGYRVLLQNEDYFKDTRVDKLATFIQIYADSFFHCLGLLDIDFSIAKLQYSGYQVTIGKSEDDNQIIQPSTQIAQQQELPSEMKSVKKDADFSGFQLLASLSIEQIVNLMEIHISDKKRPQGYKLIYTTPEGRNYRHALKLYNAYYSINLLKDITVSQGCSPPIGSEYRRNMINPTKRATDLKAFIDFNNTTTRYNRLNENLDALIVFRDHFNATQVLNEFPDHKYRLKTLLAKNKQYSLKPKGTFNQGNMDRLLDKLETLESIEPDLMKSIDSTKYNVVKPEKLMKWCLNPANIKSQCKILYFQILGYQVQTVKDNSQIYWNIQPIGNQDESLIWRHQVIEKSETLKVDKSKKSVTKC